MSPGGGRVQRVIFVIVLALAVSGLAAGCGSSSEKNSGLTSACRTVRSAFDKLDDDYRTADSAFSHAANQWNNSVPTGSPTSLGGEALTGAINLYNADLQNAKALRAKADQGAVLFNAARTACREAGMPKGCQDEFAQYQAIIDNNTLGAQADAAIEQATAAEQQVLTNSSGVGAWNEAVEAHNAGVRQSEDVTNTYNVTLLPAFNTAAEACNLAT